MNTFEYRASRFQGLDYGIDESVFKYVLKNVYVHILLPNLTFELYFEVCARTYTPTHGCSSKVRAHT